MIGVIRSVRMRILLQKKIPYCPNIYKAIIYQGLHPTEFDESDDIEHQKLFPPIESSIEAQGRSPLDSVHRIGHER